MLHLGGLVLDEFVRWFCCMHVRARVRVRVRVRGRGRRRGRGRERLPSG